MLKVEKGGLTLPARVKERQYDRDDQRRDAVPLLAGEGRMVIKKLTEGAHGVRKVIEFRKQRGKGHAAFNVKWPMGDCGRPSQRTRTQEDNGSHRQGRLAAGSEGSVGQEGG